MGSGRSVHDSLADIVNFVLRASGTSGHLAQPGSTTRPAGESAGSKQEGGWSALLLENARSLSFRRYLVGPQEAQVVVAAKFSWPDPPRPPARCRDGQLLQVRFGVAHAETNTIQCVLIRSVHSCAVAGGMSKKCSQLRHSEEI